MRLDAWPEPEASQRVSVRGRLPVSREQDPRLGDRNVLLEMLEQHYNGYLFSKHATERMFNSDLVLYFLKQIENTGGYPEQMLDMNVRADYGRLRRIATLLGAQGTETRALLEAILTEEHVSSPLVEQFGSRSMHGRVQLVSLFYYMGMLTFDPESASAAEPVLVIPNRVIRELQWEYLALALKDQENIWMETQDLSKALSWMAIQGDIQPLLVQFREQVTASEVERAFDDAYEQLDRYASDQALVPLLTLGKQLKAGVLVFVGAKDVLFRPWPRPPRRIEKTVKKKAASKKAARTHRGQRRRSAKR